MQVTEYVDQENIEPVSCAIPGSRAGTGVEFLCNLFGKIEASDWQYYLDSEFC